MACRSSKRFVEIGDGLRKTLLQRGSQQRLQLNIACVCIPSLITGARRPNHHIVVQHFPRFHLHDLA